MLTTPSLRITGTPNGTSTDGQQHREFALFNGAQTYPEIILPDEHKDESTVVEAAHKLSRLAAKMEKIGINPHPRNQISSINKIVKSESCYCDTAVTSAD